MRKMLFTMDSMTECLFLFILIFLVSHCGCDTFPACSTSDLEACGNAEGTICNGKTNKCECINGYEYFPNSPTPDKLCVKYKIDPSGDKTESNGSVTGIVVILITIGLLGTALTIIVRRYRLIPWIQQKISSRRNTGASYEDVMIGQDDPPITA